MVKEGEEAEPKGSCSGAPATTAVDGFKLSAPVGAIVTGLAVVEIEVRPVIEVMSALAPLAAAPKFERAVAAVPAPVPPLAMATVPVRLVADAATLTEPAVVIRPSAPTVNVGMYAAEP